MVSQKHFAVFDNNILSYVIILISFLQVKECKSNGGNSIQRSSSPHHVGSDLQSKHVGQNLCVLPDSVFGERGMFGILVEGTKVSLIRFYMAIYL